MLKIDNNPFAKGFRENGLSYMKRKQDATGECIVTVLQDGLWIVRTQAINILSPYLWNSQLFS
jgi:hypothetical protein